MALVDRGLRRELHLRFQGRTVRVRANGHRFVGRLLRIGRNFITMRTGSLLRTVRIARITSISRILR